jgi:hypothetical protein
MKKFKFVIILIFVITCLVLFTSCATHRTYETYPSENVIVYDNSYDVSIFLGHQRYFFNDYYYYYIGGYYYVYRPHVIYFNKYYHSHLRFYRYDNYYVNRPVVTRHRTQPNNNGRATSVASSRGTNRSDVVTNQPRSSQNTNSVNRSSSTPSTNRSSVTQQRSTTPSRVTPNSTTSRSSSSSSVSRSTNSSSSNRSSGGNTGGRR